MLDPIIFIGMPRSGTTIIFEAISAHHDLGWLSNYSYRFPKIQSITLLHRLFFGLQGRKNQYNSIRFIKKLFPEPQEVYNVWDDIWGKKFRTDFVSHDILDPNAIKKTRKLVSNLLFYQGKKRFCAKFTGPPRINFLSQAFPNAVFVDIVRDPRSVIASLLKVDWWIKKGLDNPWWEGGFDTDKNNTYISSNRSSIALAALLWCAVYEATNKESTFNNVPFIRIKYEDFISNPLKNVEIISKFCALNKSGFVNRYIEKQNYKNMNYKYKTILSSDEIRTIENIAGKHMKDLGYM